MKIAVAIAVLLCVAPCHAQAHYRSEGAMELPDLHFTPGVANPSCVADLSGKPHMVKLTIGTKAESVEENICAKDFRTAPIRASIKNFPRLKREACALYGVKNCDASVEGDHDMSIEVCGKPDDVRNIWPQNMTQARVKDHQVEDRLPKLVCAGEMSLKEAQACISRDWVACMAKIKRIQN